MAGGPHSWAQPERLSFIMRAPARKWPYDGRENKTTNPRQRAANGPSECYTEKNGGGGGSGVGTQTRADQTPDGTTPPHG